MIQHLSHFVYLIFIIVCVLFIITVILVLVNIIIWYRQKENTVIKDKPKRPTSQ